MNDNTCLSLLSFTSVERKAKSDSVIGVQSEASPAAYESWRHRRLVEAPNHTFAEGLATATAFDLPQSILWEKLDDFMLVRDEEIMQTNVLFYLWLFRALS